MNRSGQKTPAERGEKCENYGQQARNSAFEYIMEAAKSREVKEKLLHFILKKPKAVPELNGVILILSEHYYNTWSRCPYRQCGLRLFLNFYIVEVGYFVAAV